MNLSKKVLKQYELNIKSLNNTSKEIKEKIAFFKPTSLDELLQIKDINEDWVGKNEAFVEFLNTLNVIENEKLTKSIRNILYNFTQKLSIFNQQNKMIWTGKSNPINTIDLSEMKTKNINELLEIIDNPTSNSKIVKLKLKHEKLRNNQFEKQIQSLQSGDEDNEEKRLKNEKILLELSNYEFFNKIVNKSIELEKENGQKLLYVAKYYLEGVYHNPSTDKTLVVRAPIFLFPIIVKQNERTHEISLRNDIDRDIIVNPFILQNVLKRNNFHYDHKLSIKENVKNLLDDLKYELFEEFSEFKTLKIDEEILDLGFKVKNYLILGIFNFFDSSIQEEINFMIQNGIVGKNILETFSEYDIYGKNQIKKIEENARETINDDKDIYYIDKLNFQQVLALKKINDPRLNHLTIWGPPGTGKSQTILSIIIDALIKNKKIAVVTQKRVALDVIYERLGELQPFSLLITDLNDKSGFFEQIQNSFGLLNSQGESKFMYKKIDYTQRLKNNLDNLDKINFQTELEEFDSKSFLEIFSEFQKYLIEEKTLKPYRVYENELVKFSKEYKYSEGFRAFKTIYKQFSIEELEYYSNLNNKFENSSKFEDVVLKLDENRNILLQEKEVNQKEIEQFDRTSGLVKKYREIGFFSFWKKHKQLKVIYRQTTLKTKEDVKKFNYNNNIKLLSSKNDEYNDALNEIQNELEEVKKRKEKIESFNSLSEIGKEWVSKILSYINTHNITGSERNLINQVILNLWIEEKIIKSKRFQILDGRIHNWVNQVNNVNEIQDDLTTYNRNLVFDKTFNRFKEIINFNNRSNTLEKISKARKHKSIFDFFKKYGLEIKRSYPIWLMRPEVVTNLFKIYEKFDIILVDEASQLFVEQALPTLQHSNKIVVLGDEKQLSPSSFFNARVNDEDVNEDIEFIENDDSLLDFAKTKFPNVMLRNHYRSNYSDLIAYSNNKFYNNNLIATNNNSTKDINPIEFVKVENGIFENSVNQNEAKQIVQILKNISANPKEKTMSLGIITMNNSQKEFVESLINKNIQDDSALNSLIKHSNLFIKSIENVQGDERDIIIITTTYGKDTSGNLNIRFGPINNYGGENRINVAITRSKEKMYVVSSFDPYALLGKVQHAKNDGPKILAEFLIYALNPKEWLENNQIKDKNERQINEDQFIRSIFEDLSVFIKRKFKYDLIYDKADSNFGIDFMVYDPKKKQNIIGIEVDLNSFNRVEFARERDISKIQYLNARGWKIHRLWTLNWIKDKKNEMNNIAKVLSSLK